MMNKMETISYLGERYAKLGSIHDYIKGGRLKARNAILKEVIPGSQQVQISCLCGADFDDVFLAKIDRWGLPVSVVICKECGLVRLHPRWDDDTYLNIYKRYYWTLAIGVFEVSKERFQLSIDRAKGFSDYLLAHYDLTGKRVLEIGCSYGAGLYALKGCGANLVGYDYDTRILDIGRKFTGLDLRGGGLPAALTDGKRYDLVILRHVFEHLLDPITEAQSLKELLHDSGQLFIEVPGVFNEQRMEPDPIMMFDAFHTFYYSFDTLTQVMNSCGFQRIHGDEHIYSLWCIGKQTEEHLFERKKMAATILQFIAKKEKERQRRAWVDPVSHIVRLPIRLGRCIIAYFK